MNNKGFTLVEMLAVVVILAVVGGIATTSVINTINTSKKSSEKVFVGKLSNLIDDYLDLNKPTKQVGSTPYKFQKCGNSECTSKREVEAIQLQKNSGKIYLKDLVDKGIITKDKLINPKNKKECLSGNGPEIKVYRDNDYVYYYYVNLSGNCDISSENGIINTLPDSLCTKINETNTGEKLKCEE